jgi:hypothetical protein
VQIYTAVVVHIPDARFQEGLFRAMPRRIFTHGDSAAGGRDAFSEAIARAMSG